MGTEGVEPPQSYNMHCKAQEQPRPSNVHRLSLSILPFKEYRSDLLSLSDSFTVPQTSVNYSLVDTAWYASYANWQCSKWSSLYGTFIRKDQDCRYKEQPMYLTFGLSSIFILLAFGGGSPKNSSGGGTRTHRSTAYETGGGTILSPLVDRKGLEPLASCLQSRRSTNWD